MIKVSLEANKREITGKKSKTLRAKSYIPLVLYGHGFKPENIEVFKNTFIKAFHKAGSSNLVDLEIDKAKPIKVLIQDIQTDPLTDEIIHADLYRVRKDRKLRTQIPLHFRGKSPAVEDKEGNLITHKDSIEVEVLPDDLIDEIKVDISNLKTFDDSIKVSDLDIPSTILKKMNRGYTAEQYLKLIKKLKLKISAKGGSASGGKNLRLSTDIIVGFPGESEQNFKNTVRVVKKINFNKAYVSMYSPRRGTLADKKYLDNVSMREKKRRWKILECLINKSKAQRSNVKCLN